MKEEKKEPKYQEHNQKITYSLEIGQRIRAAKIICNVSADLRRGTTIKKRKPRGCSAPWSITAAPSTAKQPSTCGYIGASCIERADLFLEGSLRLRNVRKPRTFSIAVGGVFPLL